VLWIYYVVIVSLFTYDTGRIRNVPPPFGLPIKFFDKLRTLVLGQILCKLCSQKVNHMQLP